MDKKGGKNNCKKVRNKERKNTAIVIRSWVGNGRLKFKTTQFLEYVNCISENCQDHP